VPPEARQQFIPKELSSAEDIAQLLLTFRRNNGISGQDTDRAKRQVMQQAQREIEGDDRTAHFFGIKDGENMVATGKLNVRPPVGDKKVGYLSFLAVDEQYRGKGFAKQLTDIRTERARQEGCTHIQTDIFTENPIALVTKLNDGYTLTNLEFYGDEKKAGKFVLLKKIHGEREHDKKDGIPADLQEVGLSDLTEIYKLLKDGEWVGIDVKNTASADDTNPENWRLILEKSF